MRINSIVLIGTGLVLAALFFLPLHSASARDMVGVLNNLPIELHTEILESGEYILAAQLVAYFPNRWQYDGLSGTLMITRQDGVKVGMQVGDPRVLVGKRIIHTGQPPIRFQSRVYIHFYTVKEFLLPGVNLQEQNAPGMQPSEMTDQEPTPTPFLINDVTGWPTITPTPVVFPEYSDLLATPTPTPVPEAAPAAKPAPNAILILDPRIQNDQTESNSSGINESDITLGVCKQLESTLAQSPNYEVLITQRGKSKNPLSTEQRTGLANKSNADLFIGIQCGTMYTRSVSRAAVVFMNPILDSILPSSGPAAQAERSAGWDGAYILHEPESRRLAEKIIVELKDFYASANIIQIDTAPRPGRIAILRGLTMPAILIDLGNLANEDTAQYLSRPRVQEDIAYKLSLAISGYLYERSGYPSPDTPQTR